jgi:hypothetical protein
MSETNESPNSEPVGTEAALADLAKAVRDGMTELKRASDLLAGRAKEAKDWKVAFRNGLMFGLGSALGASVLVGAILAFLKPLERIETLKAPLEQLTQELQRRR